MKTIDLTGQTFTRWTVLGFAGRNKHRRMWLCRCSCSVGTVRAVLERDLLRGASQSCGCRGREARRGHTTTTHGHTRGRKQTPEYRSYVGAKARCRNSRDKDYAAYGGRGLAFNFPDFEAFYRELGPRPPGMTLDRRDNNLGYQSGNVRWATPAEQARNRRPKRRPAVVETILAMAAWTIPAQGEQQQWA